MAKLFDQFNSPQIDETFAPKFEIEVEGITVGTMIEQFITSIEFECIDNMCDMLKMNLINPNNIISDAKIFQPGNEVGLYFGYKEPLTYIGRTIIIRQEPIWPESGIPTITVTGYTKEFKMMNNAPEASQKKGKKSKKRDGRYFKDAKHSDVVTQIAEEYDFDLDIDPTDDNPKNFLQKVGKTDYELVQDLANKNNFFFWVDYPIDTKKWTLHFRGPASVLKEQKYSTTLQYNEGDKSTLLSFRPELLIKDSATKVAVVISDEKTGRIIKAEIEEESTKAPEVIAKGKEIDKKVKGEYTSEASMKLLLGDFSFTLIADRQFKTETEAILFAKDWFQKQKNDFILARGTTIGNPNLVPRQIQEVNGISEAYSGSYQLHKVRHILNNSNGYRCEISARKEVSQI